MQLPTAADPFLSASLFAAGHLDSAIAKVLLPLAAAEPEASFYFLRYGRGIEHLKLRFLGDPARAPQLRQKLTELAETFFGELATFEPAVVGDPAKQPPAIDVEDEDLSLARDRSLLFTTYRRSYIPFAGPPFLGDDALMARASALLCRQSRLYFTLYDTGETPSHKTRQNCLLRLIATGLPAFGIAETAWPTYLHYHRDWLIRWTLGAFAADQQDRLAPAIEKFDQLAQASSAAFGSLRSFFTASAKPFLPPHQEDLRNALGDLGHRAREVGATAAPDIDPYTSDASFLPLFKALHMAANALGLKMRDEAFAHHLLAAALTATDGPKAE